MNGFYMKFILLFSYSLLFLGFTSFISFFFSLFNVILFANPLLSLINIEMVSKSVKVKSYVKKMHKLEKDK